jgi:hypothetical protein
MKNLRLRSDRRLRISIELPVCELEMPLKNIIGLWFVPEFRRSFRAIRRLGLERLDARQMLDGAGTAFAALGAEGESTPMADFALTDYNSTSPTYQQPVSPRDYLEQVSGWYLGSAF